MTCQLCQERAEFAAESDYVQFRRLVLEAVGRGALELHQAGTGPFCEEVYRCRDCMKRWVLAAPDQAFRGYWKPLDGAAAPATGHGPLHARPHKLPAP